MEKYKKGQFVIDELGKWILALILLAILIVIIVALMQQGRTGLIDFHNFFRFSS